MPRILYIVLLFVFAVSMTGCDMAGSKVTGKVTLDGAPIETGSIIFSEASGKGQAHTAQIKNGEYSIIVPSGSYKVQVSAQKMLPTTSTSKSGPSEEMRDYIPSRYSGAKTELTATVDGKPVDFDLKSDTPKKK